MRYSFAAKQDEYRAPVWRAVEKLSSVPVWKRRAVILDASEGLETRHLLSLGYRPENILAVNRSAAHLAALTLTLRRLGLPRVNTRAGEYAYAIADGCEISGWRHIDVLSFDSTSTVAAGKFHLLAAVVKTFRVGVLATVCLGGRERTRYMPTLRGLSRPGARDSRNRLPSAPHEGRATAMMILGTVLLLKNGTQECVAHVRKFRWSSYLSSSGQQMVWAVGALVPHAGDPNLFKALFLPPCLAPYGALAPEEARADHPKAVAR